MIQSLFNAADDDWVAMVGRYILNLGAIEATTRLLVGAIEKSERSPVMSDDLSARLGFVKKRFPRANKVRHKWAMNVFSVTQKHVDFRNTVAHSPIAFSERKDGTFQILGILDFRPRKDDTAQLVALEELKGRVNESAALARALLEMQSDFADAR